MSLLTAGDLTPWEGHVEQILAWPCGTREGEGDSNTGAFGGLRGGVCCRPGFHHSICRWGTGLPEVHEADGVLNERNSDGDTYLFGAELT